jgi:hypothetical protein
VVGGMTQILKTYMKKNKKMLNFDK